MKHISKIIALSLALLLTVMAAVPSLEATGSFAFAANEGTVQSEENTSADKQADPRGAEAGKSAKDVSDADGAEDAVDAKSGSEAGDTAKGSDTGDTAKKGADKDSDVSVADDADKAKESAGKDKEDRSDNAESIEFKGKEFDVTIDCTPEAGMPADTKLKVGEITAKDKEYKDYYEKALAAVRDDAAENSKDKDDTRAVRFVRLYDFELTSGGEALEPGANVDVSIDYSKAVKKGKAEAAEDPGSVRVIHFTEDNSGEIKADLLASKHTDAVIEDSALTEAKFEAESFSVYAVVYTVDFHYGDGEYDFSIAGESSIMLSEVIERLHMGGLTVGDVKDAEFSDPSLVKVEKQAGAYAAGTEASGSGVAAGSDGVASDNDANTTGAAPADDWKLTSLKPFDTDETLTLTLNDGSKVVVKVTDANGIVCKDVTNNKTYTADQGGLVAAVQYINDKGGVNTATIELYEDCIINSTITFVAGNSDSRTLTIKGSGGTPIISRGSFDGVLFEATKGGLAFTGVVIDGNGNNITATGSLIKAKHILTLTDTVVRNHKSSNDAPAVDGTAINDSSKLQIIGSTTITGNKCNNGENDANLATPSNAAYTQFSSFTGSVGVVSTAGLDSQFAVVPRNDTSDLSNIKNDNHKDYLVEAGGNNNVQLFWRSYICQVNVNGTKTKYTSIQAAYDAAPDGSRIEMLMDCPLASGIAVNAAKKVTLTTAGEYGSGSATIRRAANFKNASLITVSKAGAELIIENIVLDGNNVTVTTSGGLIKATNGTVKLNDGAILQNSITSGTGYDVNGGNGAGVYIGDGSVIMNYGSVIQYCKSINDTAEGGKGGGVYVHGANAYFTMNSGSLLQYCEAYRSTFYAGGGVCVVNSNHFVMNGGTVSGCRAPQGSGGGIAIDHGDIGYIRGGTITDCTSLNRGGGVEIHGALDMSGGTITNCRSGLGGAVNFYNKGTSDSEGRLYLSGSPKIYRNYNASNELINVDVYHHYHQEAASDGNIILKKEGFSAGAIVGIWAGGDQALDQSYFGYYEDDANLNLVSAFTNDRDESLVGADGGDVTTGAYREYGKLVWAQGIKVTAKLYINNQKNKNEAIDIKGSDGRYVFNYDNVGLHQSSTVTLTDNELAENYIGEKKYNNLINSELLYSDTTRPENLSELVTNVRSTMTAVNTKQRSYAFWYSIDDGINYHDLGMNSGVVLYYSVDPACKATDENGNILYLESGNPAVFDDLAASFELLGNYYYYDSEQKLVKYTGNYQIKMLKDSYDVESAVTGAGDYNVTLTTASSSDAMFPFTGNGSVCTMNKKSSLTGASMLETSLGNLTLQNVILDGKNVESTVDGSIIKVTGNNSKLTIGAGAILRNGKTSANGGAVSLGGGTMEFSGAASITGSTSGQNGGGIYIANGAALTMATGSVTGNTGGGVYIAEGGRFNVSGSPDISGNKLSRTDDSGCDVVLASTATPNASDLHLAGNLTANINVYAVSNDHKEIGKQFAVRDNNSYTGYDKFINQRISGVTGALKQGDTTNIYWKMNMVPVTIKKEVVGSFADFSRTFEMTLNVVGDSDSQTYTVTDRARTNSTTTIGEIITNGSSFTLGKDGSITLELPAGKQVSLTETDATGYTVTTTTSSGIDTPTVSGYTISFALKDDANASGENITIVNSFPDVVPSGLKVATGIVALALVIVLAMLYAVTFRRRRSRA